MTWGLSRLERDDHVRLLGARAGRQVLVVAARGTVLTWVRAAVPDLRALAGGGGAFVVDPGAPAAGVAVLAAPGGPAGAWRDVRVRAGAEGLVAVRRSGASGHGHDLRLLERLADALDGVALAAVDLAVAEPPYRTG